VGDLRKRWHRSSVKAPVKRKYSTSSRFEQTRKQGAPRTVLWHNGIRCRFRCEAPTGGRILRTGGESFPARTRERAPATAGTAPGYGPTMKELDMPNITRTTIPLPPGAVHADEWEVDGVGLARRRSGWRRCGRDSDPPSLGTTSRWSYEARCSYATVVLTMVCALWLSYSIIRSSGHEARKPGCSGNAWTSSTLTRRTNPSPLGRVAGQLITPSCRIRATRGAYRLLHGISGNAEFNAQFW
jgi:hypothetical protein